MLLDTPRKGKLGMGGGMGPEPRRLAMVGSA
jgi:hypothetical protein